MPRPESFRFINHCKFCFHSKQKWEMFTSNEELYCEKHKFGIHSYDTTSRICDDFKEEMEDE
jgi:hypothetical protein